jgi:hypothetical protein
MGLFSSKVTYTAFAASSTLIPEEDRPNTVRQALLSAQQANESTSGAIVFGINTNLNARAESMLSYAQRPDGYIYGLPEVSHFSVYVDNADTQAAIERDIGEPIVLQSTGWGPMNQIFFDEWTASGGGTGDINDYPYPPYWMQVRYRLVSDPPTVQYWVYQIGSGNDPIYESEIQSDSLNWQYLPVAILMHDRVWFDELGVPDLEETLDRLLKRLNVDPIEVKEDYIISVQEGIDSGDRPGTKQLDDWDFFIHFATPIHSRIRGSRETIYNFLLFLEKTASWTFYDDYVNFLNGGSGTAQPQSNFHISEGENSDPDWEIISTGYEVFYAWSYVYSVTHSGQYTPPDWTEPLKSRRMYSRIYEFGDANYSEGIFEVHGPGAPVATVEPEGTYHDYAVFTQQHKDSVGNYSYTQVLIMAPSMMHVINTQDGIQYVDAPLFPEDPTEDSEFRFPVQIGSLKNTAVMHREEMLQDSLCATVFLVQKVKVKWYQKTFFKWLIIIIAVILIVLAIVFPPFLAAAAAAIGLVTGISVALIYVVLAFAMGFIISMAGALIGGTAGTIFIIVGTIASMGMTGPSGVMTATWGQNIMMGMQGFATFGAAVSTISTTFALVNMGMTIINLYVDQKAMDDLEEFYKTLKEKQKELEEAYDLLGPAPVGVDPFDLKDARDRGATGEHPDSYLMRTLNFNPGLLGYALVYNFTELALIPPSEFGQRSIIDMQTDSFKRQRGET